jgi:general secretion pathway protein F
MGGFDYEAIDNGGAVVRGTLRAGSAREARAQLAGKGLTPVKVKDSVAEGPSGLGALFSRRVGASDLLLMTRQFASLAGAQVPLAEALSVMARQTESARLRQAMEALLTRVREGSTLAGAMEEIPGVFPRIYRAMVAAGEKSGELSHALESLADYLESSEEIRRKTALAAVYPIFVVSFALVAITGLMVYVVPKITRVFMRTGQHLPWLTQALIAISSFLSGWGLLALPALAILAAGAVWAIRRDPAKALALHRLALAIPLVGSMIRSADSTAMTQSLAILLGGKAPLLFSLRTAAAVMRSLPLKMALEEAAEAVAEGASLAGALERSGGFPPIVIQFIATGEKNGQLDKMMERAYRQQNRELEAKSAMLTSVLGPALIVFMGVMVLLIVLAVLMPIFEMNQMIR